jgi:hypothetical protein
MMASGDVAPTSNSYRFATSGVPFGVVKAIDGRLVAYGQPLAIGVHGELDAGVAELSLYVCGAFPLLQ